MTKANQDQNAGEQTAYRSMQRSLQNIGYCLPAIGDAMGGGSANASVDLGIAENYLLRALFCVRRAKQMALAQESGAHRAQIQKDAVAGFEYVDAQGNSLDEIRVNAKASNLARRGDMRLIWVNEGDLAMSAIACGDEGVER
ncbi:hypothetical protein SAMN02744133_108200 [Thalassospira xiamenensis M-5 = DSM 17429]|nr:hypothetical protein [Thalassospira xiamenensis]SIT22411.1 hypothetical protein SAMN02744133_108200 [Thalassospira xiamenensis M-5 = DSM 17429]